jgi:hypothetical protein
MTDAAQNISHILNVGQDVVGDDDPERAPFAADLLRYLKAERSNIDVKVASLRGRRWAFRRVHAKRGELGEVTKKVPVVAADLKDTAMRKVPVLT